MNIYKEFNQCFFDGFPNLHWYDKQGVCDFSKTRVVTITLDDVGTSKNYNGYWVEIYNKKTGSLIIKKFFKFSNYLKKNSNSKYSDFHIWENDGGKFDWYKISPSYESIEKMCKIIFQWINHFA